MKPKKIWANLGVTDLDKTSRFYTELGFKSNGENDELTSFFVGEDDFVVHFFLKEVLETNGNVKIIDSQTANEVMFTLSAQSKVKVNNWAKEVEKAGGKLVTKPKEFGEGYYGFVFADPDGHKFNVFYM